MKMYRITTSFGKVYWARTQADAKTIAKRVGSEPVQTNVPTDHVGLCDFLNSLHDSGPTSAPPVETSSPPPPSGSALLDAGRTVDEAWQTLSLSRKLHFAALAMEDARDSL